MKKFLVLVFLLFTACGSENRTEDDGLFSQSVPSQNLRLSLKISQDSPLLVQAGQWWNDQTGFAIFSEDGEIEVHLNLVESNDPALLEYDAFTTYYDDVSGRWCEIKFDKNFYENDWRAKSLMEHELGHCIGLSHVRNVSSIMNPGITGHQVVTPDILALIDQAEAA